MDKRFLAILAAIVIAFGGFVYFNNQKKDNGKQVQVKPTSNYYGKLDSPVTFTEYGDFQCNACAAFEPTMSAVREAYKDKVRFQFRHFPITSAHPNAFVAARASEAASMQGKFWEMHDLLYASSNWQAWTNSTSPNELLQGYATQIGLNASKFKTDMLSSKVNNIINADMDALKATKAKLATPTFFLNGKYVENEKMLDQAGQPSIDKIKALLDEALKKAGVEVTAPAATPSPEATEQPASAQ